MESIDKQPITQGPKSDEEVGMSRAEGPSSSSSSSSSSFMGKHRMQAAISNLHNQINLIQEELKVLETVGESSVVCDELISTIDSVPDPLLPITVVPPDNSWDRWFRPAHNFRTNKRWI